MNKVECSLNFMYSMERFATAVYRAQKGGFKNKAILEKLKYAIDNERQHATNLRDGIIELGHTPTKLSLLFSMVGSLLGGLSRCLGQKLTLRTDIVIEKRAVKDYSYFLRTLELDDTTKGLIRNIITDEERHIKNWRDSIELLQVKNES
ncbi:MAG: ferritin-like domain-containing protein [candidate division WOR-3 bacterium]